MNDDGRPVRKVRVIGVAEADLWYPKVPPMTAVDIADLTTGQYFRLTYYDKPTGQIFTKRIPPEELYKPAPK